MTDWHGGGGGMRSLTFLACLAMTACDGRFGASENCIFHSAPLSSSATAGSKADQCIHRSAILLAPAPDPADTVAVAVLNACQLVVEMGTEELTQAMKPDHQISENDDETLREWVKKDFHDRAIFRIVQARAGKCKAP